MIPVEIAVICLVLFILYQSVMGWLTRGKFEKELADQKNEIDALRQRVDVLDTDLDHIDKRVEALERK